MTFFQNNSGESAHIDKVDGTTYKLTLRALYKFAVKRHIYM